MPAAALEAAAYLTLVAIALLAYATLQGYRFTVRPLIVGMANIVRAFAVTVPLVGRVGPGPWMADQLHNLDRIITSSLGFAITRSEAGAVALFNGSAELFKWMASEIAGLAHDTLHAFQAQAAHTGALTLKAVNRLIHASTAALDNRLTRTFGIQVHGLAVRLTHLGSQTIALEHDLAHWRGFTAKQLRAALRQLARLGPWAAYATVAALGVAILRKLHLSWLRSHRSAAGLVAAGLATLGLSFIRCDRVGRAGRGVCGMDDDLLQGLLDGALLLAGTVSLVEFIREAQAVEDEAIAALGFFIRDAPF